MSDGTNKTLTKAHALESLRKQTEKLSIDVTFESTYGQERSYKLSAKNFSTYVSGHEGSHLSSKPTISRLTYEKTIADLIEKWAMKLDALRMTAITVRATNCPMDSLELRRLAMEAWCEAVGIAPPTEADLKQEADGKRSKLKGLKEAMIAELRAGASGVSLWNARSQYELTQAKHFRKTDWQGCNLTGAHLDNLDFESSNFADCQMQAVKARALRARSCTFCRAILDGSDASFMDAKAADFSRASMLGTNLNGAMLTNANFDNADLTGANLDHADLFAANFSTARLIDVNFNRARFDEHTKWPPGFVPAQEGIIFAGQGKDPFLIERVKALKPGSTIDFATFVERLEKDFDQQRLKKAMKMLKAESFQLFAEVKPDSIVGVVKSQTDRDLVYSCRLAENGAYGCCTQNLNNCGGLRGALCKHLLVLIIGLTRGDQLDAMTACEWVMASKSKNSNLDKELMSAIFLRYKGAEAGEIDWRPMETLPEDYYAY